jgi:hypothetical protein
MTVYLKYEVQELVQEPDYLPSKATKKKRILQNVT